MKLAATFPNSACFQANRPNSAKLNNSDGHPNSQLMPPSPPFTLHTWKGDHISHIWHKLQLQLKVDNLGPLHRLCPIQAGNIPSTQHDLFRFHHGQQTLEGCIYLFTTQVPDAAGS